jgi:hypothetical protein
MYTAKDRPEAVLHGPQIGTPAELTEEGLDGGWRGDSAGHRVWETLRVAPSAAMQAKLVRESPQADRIGTCQLRR